MLSKKRGYKVNVISTSLGSVVEAKKLVKNHYQQTIGPQKTSRNYIILLNGECTCKSAEAMLRQKRRYKVNSISTYLELVVDVKKIIQIITNRLLDNKEPTKFRLF